MHKTVRSADASITRRRNSIPRFADCLLPNDFLHTLCNDRSVCGVVFGGGIQIRGGVRGPPRPPEYGRVAITIQIVPANRCAPE